MVLDLFRGSHGCCCYSAGTPCQAGRWKVFNLVIVFYFYWSKPNEKFFALKLYIFRSKSLIAHTSQPKQKPFSILEKTIKLIWWRIECFGRWLPCTQWHLLACFMTNIKNTARKSGSVFQCFCLTCKEWDWRCLQVGEVGLTGEPRLGRKISAF